MADRFRRPPHVAMRNGLSLHPEARDAWRTVSEGSADPMDRRPSLLIICTGGLLLRSSSRVPTDTQTFQQIATCTAHLTTCRGCEATLGPFIVVTHRTGSHGGPDHFCLALHVAMEIGSYHPALPSRGFAGPAYDLWGFSYRLRMSSSEYRRFPPSFMSRLMFKISSTPSRVR